MVITTETLSKNHKSLKAPLVITLENSYLEESGSGVFFDGSKISGPPFIILPVAGSADILPGL